MLQQLDQLSLLLYYTEAARMHIFKITVCQLMIAGCIALLHYSSIVPYILQLH